jgi:hypothetical protein
LTTIVADPATGVMVTDSQIADGDQKWSVGKVERIDGTLYAAAGDAVDGERFYEWVRKGRKGRKPKLSEEEFNALALNKTGLYWFDNKLHPMRMKHPFAIGSGGKAARALLIAGIEIIRAVEIVCEVDAGSSLPVQIYKLNEENQE